jgi:hypothetical protein
MPVEDAKCAFSCPGLSASHFALKKKIFSLVHLIVLFSYGINGLKNHR